MAVGAPNVATLRPSPHEAHAPPAHRKAVFERVAALGIIAFVLVAYAAATEDPVAPSPSGGESVSPAAIPAEATKPAKASREALAPEPEPTIVESEPASEQPEPEPAHEPAPEPAPEPAAEPEPAPEAGPEPTEEPQPEPAPA